MAGRLGASTEEGRVEGESGDDGEAARERERERGRKKRALGGGAGEERKGEGFANAPLK